MIFSRDMTSTIMDASSTSTTTMNQWENEPSEVTSSSISPLTPLHFRIENPFSSSALAPSLEEITCTIKRQTTDSDNSNSNSSNSPCFETSTVTENTNHPSWRSTRRRLCRRSRSHVPATVLFLVQFMFMLVLVTIVPSPPISTKHILFANAIAIRNGNSSLNRNLSSIKSKSSSSSPSPSTSSSASNALALLNEARLLREQRLLSLQSQSKSQSRTQPQLHQPKKKTKKNNQSKPDIHPSLTLNELLRRTKENNSQNQQQQQQQQQPSAWTTALFDESAAIKSASEESYITNQVEKQLPSVKSLLRTSIGNDVPDMELHLQMEAARARGKQCSSVAALAFMELYCSSNGGSAGVADRYVEKSRQVGGIKSSLGGGTAVSAVEKVAMSSLPSQLPGLAAPVLNVSGGHEHGRVKTQKQQRPKIQKKRSGVTSTHITASTVAKKLKKKKTQVEKKGKAKKNSTTSKHTTIKKIQIKEVSTIMTARKQFSKETPKTESTTSLHSASPTDRVSHDEEIQLARIIQRGAELHSIKTKFEQQHTRDISRQEWTELAKLDSPKDLRRLVSDYRRAKSKLVMANMGLVHAVVKTRMRESGGGSVSFSGISYEELVQEGSLGLLRAAELFDPKRGLRFSTYATIWIKGVLGNNSLSEAITLPLREKNKWKKIQDSIEEISAVKGVDKDGRDYKPSEEEIGTHCGLTPTEVKGVMTKMKRTKNVLSLDYQYDSTSRSGTESGQFNALANDKNLMDDVDLVERLQLRADIVATLTKNLDQREARLMRLRYGLNDGKTRSIRECADSMGISRARAQQLAAGCLKKLREADDAESLQEYLLSIA